MPRKIVEGGGSGGQKNLEGSQAGDISDQPILTEAMLLKIAKDADEARGKEVEVPEVDPGDDKGRNEVLEQLKEIKVDIPEDVFNMAGGNIEKAKQIMKARDKYQNEWWNSNDPMVKILGQLNEEVILLKDGLEKTFKIATGFSVDEIGRENLTDHLLANFNDHYHSAIELIRTKEEVAKRAVRDELEQKRIEENRVREVQEKATKEKAQQEAYEKRKAEIEAEERKENKRWYKPWTWRN